MNNKELLRKAFERVSPSEELIERTLAIQTQSIAKRNRAKFRFTAKKMFTAAAVFAVLICGVSAAAAGGIADFEVLFGNFIRVEKRELADGLIGKISDVRYKVSDRDYVLSVKGAAGSDRDMIVILELSRSDGTPVREHFQNPALENRLHSLRMDADIAPTYRGGFSRSGDIYINDEGNIELMYEINADFSTDGKVIKMSGKDFYPISGHMSFMSDNGIYYGRHHGKWGYYLTDENGYGTDTPADIDDSLYKLLDLEWEIKFRYSASEGALRTIKCASLPETAVYYQDVYEMTVVTGENGYKSGSAVLDTLKTVENKAVIEEIEIGALYGHIKFDYPLNEYEKADMASPLSYGINNSEKNEIYLIKTDGTHIPVHIGGSSARIEDGVYKCDINLTYTGDSGSKQVTDINDIGSVCINGVVCPLS